jgi:hypothetical protein
MRIKVRKLCPFAHLLPNIWNSGGHHKLNLSVHLQPEHRFDHREPAQGILGFLSCATGYARVFILF